jgi:hypothetical protein
MITKPSIADLEEIADSLPAGDKGLFRQIFAVTTTIGQLRTPPSMQPWVAQQFGSVAAVTRQKIVRVTNLVTCEETLFNELRARRPLGADETGKTHARLDQAGGKDPFGDPEENTPEDLFGRVAGRHCVTASNIAKAASLHSVVIFNDFNPLPFTKEKIIDYIDTGWEWARRAQAAQPEAKYFALFWNCLWRAGASIVHGHAQVMLTRGRHYAKIEALRRAALSYQQNYGSNYFADLFRVHRSVGCALEQGGVKIMASLTPFRDDEVIIMADELNIPLKERVYEVLAHLRDRLGVVSFNLGLITPPLAETEESWQGFPVIARVVNRGDLNNRTSDIGGAEIYAASVISSDPFELARQLRQHLD